MFEPVLLVVDYVTMFFNGIGQFASMSYSDSILFFNGDIDITLYSSLSDNTILFTMINFNDFPLIGNTIQEYINMFFALLFFPVNGDINMPFYICTLFGVLRVFFVVCCVDIIYKILGLFFNFIDLVLPT